MSVAAQALARIDLGTLNDFDAAFAADMARVQREQVAVRVRAEGAAQEALVEAAGVVADVSPLTKRNAELERRVAELELEKAAMAAQSAATIAQLEGRIANLEVGVQSMQKNREQLRQQLEAAASQFPHEGGLPGTQASRCYRSAVAQAIADHLSS